MATRPASRDDFRVAIMCTLLCEYNAVSLLFDHFWDEDSDPYGKADSDPNTYVTGRIGHIDVVFVRLPEMGKISATSAAAGIRSSYPKLEVALLTGICGGVPHANGQEILLGDVILANTVVQYDHGREYEHGFVAKTTVEESLGRPNRAIRSLLAAFETDLSRERLESRTAALLRELQDAASTRRRSASYQYPGIERDMLFEPTHLHTHQPPDPCKACSKKTSCGLSLQSTCDELGCGRDGDKLVCRRRLEAHKNREKAGSAPLNPFVFFGRMGSGDKVIKSGRVRDHVAKTHNLIAFEMEGAGVWDEMPCIIIKSVCDYADSHKNKQWQNYAAATAASATRALIERYPETDRKRSDLVGREKNQLHKDDYQKSVAACRNALSLTDPVVHLETLKSTKGHRTQGTCEWIKDDEIYQSWLSGDSQWLWISGGPGRGKTMLSIFLAEELKRDTQKRKDAELLFCFCDHQDESRNNAVAVLRTLVYQLVAKHPHLIKNVSIYFDSEERAQTTVSSAEALWIVFKDLLQAELGTVLCVIDGLDECDDDSTRLLVGKFSGFFSSEKSNQRLFRLAIVSRKMDGLDAFCQVGLDLDGIGHVSEDIAKFISAKVEQLNKVDGFCRIRQEVQDTLLARAEGTFLWVSAVMMELLKKKTCTEIMETLTDHPPGLGAIYTRMLQNIESSRWPMASKILRWVVMAVRPLTLEQLAAAVRPESTAGMEVDEVMRDYIALCEPMLKMDGQKVDLVHQSARDYLLGSMSGSDQPPRQFHIKTGEAHSDLLGVCLDYIEKSNVCHRFLGTASALAPRNSSFLNYASQCWPEHARHSTCADDHLRLSKTLMGKQSVLRTNWWETHGTNKCIASWPLSYDLPALHLACLLGIERLARQLLSTAGIVAFVRVNTADKMGRPPLLYAIHGGNETLVRLLLEKGAYVNRVSAKDDQGSHIALLAAAQFGYEAIVRLLLERKHTDINVANKDGSTALMLATLHGYDTIMELLLRNKANANARDKYGSTALLIAADEGDEAATKLLLEYNADVNAKDEDGNTALLVASWAADYTTVQLLLEHGAYAGMRNWDSNTALLIAAQYGDEANIKLLLEHSAWVHAKLEYYGTALIKAAEAGHDKAVKLLLEKGADISPADDCCSAAVMQVALGGHEKIPSPETIVTREKIWRLRLTYSCMNVARMNKYGGTALIQAALKGHEKTVKLLLENGTDVNAVDDYGGTALMQAALGGHETIVKLLLPHGCCINAMDDYGSTALIQAALKGHETTVKLLLANGADANTKNWMGMSALKLAAERGHEGIVRLLQERLSQSRGVF